MKVICQIDVTVGPDYKPVTVQVEESGGLLALREVRRGEVQGSQLEAEPELGVTAHRHRWSGDLNLVIGVRSAP